jgi:DNA-binding transcriptional LysR family regulator
MEFRQIQTFMQIAQVKNFSKTAELLGYSQSAVTVQIRQLETELGVRLFDRTGKKVILTPKGKEFLIHANKIIDEMHKAKDAMNDTAELKNPLHIGTIESLCTVKLQAVARKANILCGQTGLCRANKLNTGNRHAVKPLGQGI